MRFFFLLPIVTLSFFSYDQDDICDSWEDSYTTCIISSPKVFPYSKNVTTSFEAPAFPTAAATTDPPWYFILDPRPSENFTLTFNTSVTLRTGGSLSCLRKYTCVLRVEAVGNWQQEFNSSIEANTVDLVAASLLVSSGSTLSATGLGLAYGWLPGVGRGGGSYAGSGGLPACTSNLTSSCCSGTPFSSTNVSSLGMGFSGTGEDPHDWDLAWGSGGGGESGGRSGGRVRVNVTGDVIVEGTIEADGAPPNLTAPSLGDSQASAGGGSGSGGTVIVLAGGSIGNTQYLEGYISARGGAAGVDWGGGGGGRVVLAALSYSISVGPLDDSMFTLFATASGGGMRDAGDPTSHQCTPGSPGTVFISVVKQPSGAAGEGTTGAAGNNNFNSLYIASLFPFFPLDTSTVGVDGYASTPLTITDSLFMSYEQFSYTLPASLPPPPTHPDTPVFFQLPGGQRVPLARAATRDAAVGVDALLVQNSGGGMVSLFTPGLWLRLLASQGPPIGDYSRLGVGMGRAASSSSVNLTTPSCESLFSAWSPHDVLLGGSRRFRKSLDFLLQRTRGGDGSSSPGREEDPPLIARVMEC